MILALDEPLPEKSAQQIKAIPGYRRCQTRETNSLAQEL